MKTTKVLIGVIALGLVGLCVARFQSRNSWNFQAQDVVMENTRRELASIQYMHKYKGKWEKNDQVFLGFRSVVERVQLTFTSHVDCAADVILEMTSGPDFGRVVIVLNNQLAGTHDGYVASDVTRFSVPLGKLHIQKGTNLLGVTPVGKHEKSASINAGVDSIRWICQ